MKLNCNGCGLCCSLFYINLSEEEYKSKKFQTIFPDIGEIDNFSEAKKCGANLLAKKENGDCIYLLENKCSIHEERPVVCRKFFCTTKSKHFEHMVEIIEESDTKNSSSVMQKKADKLI